MPTNIITHNSATTTNEPANLEVGELAVNVADQKLWVGDGTATPVPLVGGGLVVAGSTDGQTLRWEADNSAWEPASALVVDDLGNVSIANNTNPPVNRLYVEDTTVRGSTADSHIARFVKINNGVATQNAVMSLVSGNDKESRFSFESAANAAPGRIAYNHAAAYMSFSTNNNSERMRITSAGNVGIGTATPDRELVVKGAGANARFDLLNSTNAIRSSFYSDSNGAAIIGADEDGVSSLSSLRFKVFGTEMMRIDSAGNVLVGKTTGSGSKLEVDQNMTGVGPGIAVKNTNGTFGGSFLRFFNSAGAVAGQIVHSASTAVQYATTSDYRVKENVVALSGALDRVALLKPSRFNFIADPTTEVDGFIAHEAQAVVPEAVTGEKDAEEMQGIDQSKLVPLLTAAIQELTARLEALEA